LEQPISEPLFAKATESSDPVEAVRNEVRAELDRPTAAATDGVRLSGEPSYRSDARPLDPFLMQPVSFDAEKTVEVEGIVVVDSGTTTRNGAYMATELASYGEVVIGG
jgi:hypothetical protein